MAWLFRPFRRIWIEWQVYRKLETYPAERVEKALREQQYLANKKTYKGWVYRKVKAKYERIKNNP